MKPYGRALVRVLLTVAVILPATAACGTNATPGRPPAPTVTTPPPVPAPSATPTSPTPMPTPTGTAPAPSSATDDHQRDTQHAGHEQVRTLRCPSNATMPPATRSPGGPLDAGHPGDRLGQRPL